MRRHVIGHNQITLLILTNPDDSKTITAGLLFACGTDAGGNDLPTGPTIHITTVWHRKGRMKHANIVNHLIRRSIVFYVGSKLTGCNILPGETLRCQTSGRKSPDDAADGDDDDCNDVLRGFFKLSASASSFTLPPPAPHLYHPRGHPSLLLRHTWIPSFFKLSH